MRTAIAVALLVLGLAGVSPSHGQEYEYDARGRLVRVVYPDFSEIQYVYDLHGNRTHRVVVQGNRPPVAVNDSYSQAAGATATLHVLANDSDPDGHPLTITAVSAPSRGGTAARTNNNTRISYTAGTVGTETFTYTISDGHGGTATATVTVTVGNTPPVAVNDSYSQAAGATATLHVLANDSDANGHPLTITAVSAPSRGGTAVRTNNNTRISYTAGTVGTETFTYTISDGHGGTATATVTVTVGNTPPVAVNDSYSQAAGATATLHVLANDSDANGHPLTITAVSAPSRGGTAVRTNNNTRISYTAGTVGTETFTYTISDGHGGTATATVTVNVQTPPSQLVANNVSQSLTVHPFLQNAQYTNTFSIPIFSASTDASGNTRFFSAASGASEGTTSFSAETLTYTFSYGFMNPRPAGTYTDQFIFTVTNNLGHTDTGTVNVTITVLP